MPSDFYPTEDVGYFPFVIDDERAPVDPFVNPAVEFLVLDDPVLVADLAFGIAQ